MPGKCKILLVLGAFLAISILTIQAAQAQTVDDCTCPAGGCTPGATGMGAFQNQVTAGLGSAGQDKSKSYMYGSLQVGNLNVQSSYGLNNIGGVFSTAIGALDTLLDAIADPYAYIANEVATAILSNLVSKFPAVNGMLDNLSCMPVPSFKLSATISTYGFTQANNNCNGVLPNSLINGAQQSLSNNIYNLMWGQ